ncbi:MAG TPA: hypothetical protein V6D23_17710 [Candidatus Obscuribacterales bacterium]
MNKILVCAFIFALLQGCGTAAPTAFHTQNWNDPTNGGQNLMDGFSIKDCTTKGIQN